MSLKPNTNLAETGYVDVTQNKTDRSDKDLASRNPQDDTDLKHKGSDIAFQQLQGSGTNSYAELE